MAKKRGLFGLLKDATDRMTGNKSSGNEAATDQQRASARYQREKDEEERKKKKRQVELKRNEARKDYSRRRGEYEPFKY